MNRIDGKIMLLPAYTRLGTIYRNRFAESGAAGLVICGRTGKWKLCKSEIKSKFNIRVEYVQADLANFNDCQRVIKKSDSCFEKVDILVNAAGLTDRGNFLILQKSYLTACLQ